MFHDCTINQLLVRWFYLSHHTKSIQIYCVGPYIFDQEFIFLNWKIKAITPEVVSLNLFSILHAMQESVDNWPLASITFLKTFIWEYITTDTRLASADCDCGKWYLPPDDHMVNFVNKIYFLSHDNSSGLEIGELSGGNMILEGIFIQTWQSGYDMISSLFLISESFFKSRNHNK